tara:strand:+ start:658 stop:774 length:117 start_codon:yes stop_codon:yes gene_type:complete
LSPEEMKRQVDEILNRNFDILDEDKDKGNQVEMKEEES